MARNASANRGACQTLQKPPAWEPNIHYDIYRLAPGGIIASTECVEPEAAAARQTRSLHRSEDGGQ